MACRRLRVHRYLRGRTDALKSKIDQIGPAGIFEDGEGESIGRDPADAREAISKMDEVACHDSGAGPSTGTFAAGNGVSRHQRKVGARRDHDQDGETGNAKEIAKHPRR